MYYMKYNIRGDKMVVTEAIRDYAEEKLGKLEKYFKDDDITANVLTRVRGNSQIVEVTIPTSKFVLRSEEENEDLYAAIDLVSDKLERQIRKNKTKIRSKKSKANYESFIVDFEVEKEEENENLIVKRKELDTKPMSEEEAVLQMELVGHPFFIFKNATTDNISVVYKRKDGNYGIIDTK